MECPKCGRTVEDGAFICPGCEFILDTSFLGDDITDDERAIRKKKTKYESPKKTHEFGEDAMILGNPAEQEWSDFGSRDAGVSPWVCLHHFTLPGWFQDEHAFLDDKARGYYWPRPVAFCAEAFVDLVYGCKPMNEPVA